jgi:ABC-type microcin C transport system permease subunit YejB
MLDCVVCTSFWTALFCDCLIFLFSGGAYFCWPLSGFATLGFTWLVYQILDAKDRQTSALIDLAEKVKTNEGGDQDVIE